MPSTIVPAAFAALITREDGVPTRAEFVGPDRAQALAEQVAGHFSHPAAQAVVMAGVELLVDRDNFLLDGADPLSVLAAAGLSLREANRKLDRVLDGIDRIEGQIAAVRGDLERMERKVDRIDVTVQDRALLDQVRHCTRESLAADGLDVRGLSEGVLTALAMFERVFEGSRLRLGDEVGLELYGDTRDALVHLASMLRGLRLTTFASVNQEAGGDPARVVGSDPVRDYWPDGAGSALVAALQFELWRAHKRTRDEIYIWSKGHPFINERDMANWLSRGFAEVTRETLAARDRDAIRIERRLCDFVGRSDPAEFVLAFQPWWLYETDAGLLWRVRREAEGLLDGYRPFLGSKRPAPQTETVLLLATFPDASTASATAPPLNGEIVARPGE